MYVSEGCFPSEAKVSLENGKSVTMSELQIGDKVKIGRYQTSKISLFLHCNDQ